MSMHLRGSRDMMGNSEEGWWKSRTGMEQKLLILCTILFIVAFSLTIALIVAKNKTKPNCDVTTIAPTPTGETVTSTESPPETSSETESSTSVEPETTSAESETTSAKPETTSVETETSSTESTTVSKEASPKNDPKEGPVHVTARMGA